MQKWGGGARGHSPLAKIKEKTTNKKNKKKKKRQKIKN